MDTNFFSDKKIKLLKGEFGVCGLLIVVAAFCRVYSTNGYYMSFDDDDAILMADEIGCTPQLVREVVQGCLKRSVFDDGVFKVFGVLTSPGIQRRYIRAVSKRDDIQIFQEYWLLDLDNPEDVPKAMRVKVTLKSISGEINGVFGGINGVSSPGNPQSRVKESRVKKSRVEESACAREPLPPPDTLEAYASSQLNSLSPRNMEELDAYMQDMPEELIRHAIDEACAYGVRTWAYTRAIINQYQREGYKTVGDVLAAKAVRQKQQPSSPSRPNPALAYSQREHTEADYAGLLIDLSKEDQS